MALSFDSPRLSIREASFSDARDILDSVGHVVIDNLWNKTFLAKLRQIAEIGFRSSGTDSTFLAYTLPDAVDREFFLEFERSGAPALLRELLNGDFFVGISERVIRRADASVATRFSGLHQDGQLRPCAKTGINSQREFTIWTPLVDCTDEMTPRLLLLSRGDKFEDIFFR